MIPMSGMRNPDREHGPGSGARQDEARATAPGCDPAKGALRILVVDADATLFALLTEWFGACECVLEQVQTGEGIEPECRSDAVIVDVAFPRQGGAEAIRRVARAQPGTPIIVLSSSFFAGIEPTGAVARSLGVAAVLPKPLKREALHDAVERIVRLRR